MNDGFAYTKVACGYSFIKSKKAVGFIKFLQHGPGQKSIISTSNKVDQV
jgi:hypothetical protein